MKTCPRERCQWLQKISATTGMCGRGKCYIEEQEQPAPPPPPARPKEYYTWNPQKMVKRS